LWLLILLLVYLGYRYMKGMFKFPMIWEYHMLILQDPQIS
jgi:hypothetical protein